MQMLGVNMQLGIECGLFLWNGAIAACAGNNWKGAVALFHELQLVILADVVSFNAAMEVQTAWRTTCSLYVDMSSKGLRTTDISLCLRQCAGIQNQPLRGLRYLYK